MNISELTEFAKETSGRLRVKYPNFNLETEMLYQMCKVTEEVGEMSDELLKHLGSQRQDKLDGFKKEHLAEEMADVILAVLIAAEVAGIEIEPALSQKMEKVRSRSF